MDYSEHVLRASVRSERQSRQMWSTRLEPALQAIYVNSENKDQAPTLPSPRDLGIGDDMANLRKLRQCTRPVRPLPVSVDTLQITRVSKPLQRSTLHPQEQAGGMGEIRLKNTHSWKVKSSLSVKDYG